MAQVNIPNNYGALLLGGLIATILSGTVIVQVLIYFRLYPQDKQRDKALVLVVCFLDICHTGFIWASLWSYLIDHFGDPTHIDFIPWNIALTIVFTAILTLFVHCFLAHRIHMLSKKNWILSIPITILALFRLVSACVTASEMITLHSFTAFKDQFRWVFTLGLALSTCVDILITVCLFFLLQTSRTGAEGLNLIIDSLIRYAFETGSLTCAGTVAAMLCWLTMSDNLIFMGLHFVIGKFYATSLLVTLNSRKRIRRSRSQPSRSEEGVPIHLDARRLRNSKIILDGGPESKGQKLEINVERSIQYEPY